MLLSDSYKLKQNQSKPQRPKVVANESNPQLSSDNEKVVSSEENVDLSAHSMSACGENEPDFNSDVTPIKANSSVSGGVDLDCEIVGATQYSGTKPPKKVNIEPNN
ncbi:unnamed protein product [Lathyrus oleraceus]